MLTSFDQLTRKEKLLLEKCMEDVWIGVRSIQRTTLRVLTGVCIGHRWLFVHLGARDRRDAYAHFVSILHIQHHSGYVLL